MKKLSLLILVVLALCFQSFAAPVTTGTWDRFSSQYWLDFTPDWFPAVASAYHTGNYTEFDGRSCMSMSITNSGQYLFLISDWFYYPRDLSGYETLELEFYAPQLPNTNVYSIDLLVKLTDDQAVNEQKGTVAVTNAGWYTVSIDLDPAKSGDVSLFWISIGGGLYNWASPNLPQGESLTVYFDKLCAVPSNGIPLILDPYDAEPNWPQNPEKWITRPWNWRLTGDIDGWAANTLTPWATAPGKTNDNCLVIAYDPIKSTKTQAVLDPVDEMNLDLTQVDTVSADIYSIGSLPLMTMGFDDSTQQTTIVQSTWEIPALSGAWTTLTWNLPKSGSSINWADIDTMRFIVDSSDPAKSGTLFIDNLSFGKGAYVNPSNRLFVSVAPAGAGTVDIVPDKEWYGTTEVVTLTATALGDYRFRDWRGDIETLENPLVVTMNVSRAIVALFVQPVQTGVWDNFESAFFLDDSWDWGGFAPPCADRIGNYVEFNGRSCLSMGITNSGKSFFLRSDWFFFPRDLSAYTKLEIDLYAPTLSQPYDIQFLCKNTTDAMEQSGQISVSAGGWKTVSIDLDPTMSKNISLLWMCFGGGVLNWEQPNLPVGESFTFYVDEIRATGAGTEIIDSFERWPNWPREIGDWHTRPWHWDCAGDIPEWSNSPRVPWGGSPERENYNSLVLAYDASIGDAVEARMYPQEEMDIDLTEVNSVSVDLFCDGHAPLLAIGFSSGVHYARSNWQVAPQSNEWQTLTWNLPKISGDGFDWSGLNKIIFQIDTSDPDAAGVAYFDSISFGSTSQDVISNQLFYSVQPVGAGSITATPDRDWYGTNEIVSLSATANSEYEFYRWAGDINSTDNPLILTMKVSYAVVAVFNKPVEAGMWEPFDSPFWYDECYNYGNWIAAAARRLSYTNVSGRSVLSYKLINTGNNAFLRSDWMLYPQFWDGMEYIGFDVYAPELSQSYSIDLRIKDELDTPIAGTNITVSAAGWYSVKASLIEPDLYPVSVIWLSLGGGMIDWEQPDMPTAENAEFFIDTLYVGGQTRGTVVLDDFVPNSIWQPNGNWTQRQRNWRYFANTDFVPYTTGSMEPFGWDPGTGSNAFNLAMEYNADISGTLYAKIENIGDLNLSLANVELIEADIWITRTNSPLWFAFWDGSTSIDTPIERSAVAGSWQHVSFTLPKGSTEVNWKDIEKMAFLVGTDTLSGNPGSGMVYVDNIAFDIPEPSVLFLPILLGLAVLRNRKK